MKTLLKTFRAVVRGLVVCGLVVAWSLPAPPFYYRTLNANGTAQTNVITMRAWPPATNTFTLYGTNIIFGGQQAELTLTPSATGFLTNWAFPNSYRFVISNLGNATFYGTLPDTTNLVNLGDYLSAVPTVGGVILSPYGVITNQLGFGPASNSYAGIAAALGFNPASNNAAGIKFALGYTPATNSLVGITNALGYNPQNATFAALTNTIGYVPQPTNVVLTAGVLPQIGTVGVTNLNSTLLTNLGTGTVMIWTNLAIGTAPTMGAPDGSLLMSTNGNFYTRSNATWINLK